MLKFLYDLFQARKMKRAVAASDGPSERCVACDGDDLTVVADDVYRCNTCGYEGGDGLAAYLEGQERAQVLAMAPEARRAAARRHLEGARSMLLGAEGTMKSADGWSKLDIVGLGGASSMGGAGEGGQRKHTELQAVLAEMLTAKRDIDRALFELHGDDSAAASEFDAEIGYGWTSADLYFDNFLVDLAFHRRLKRVSADLEKLRLFCEDAYRREFGDVD